MKYRRLLPLIALLALVVAPFGRIAAAEAMAPAHHAGPAASGHCDDMPAPGGDEADKAGKALHCMTACASLAAVTDAAVPMVVPAAMAIEAVPSAGAAGLNPEAEPPPPRLS